MRRTLPVLLCAVIALVACGSDDDGTAGTGSVDTTEAPADPTVPDDSIAAPDDGTNPDKPTVEIPADLPTELVVTVLEPGSGRKAESGDTVIVDYVGVRSEDGVEFDNSYDRRQPYPVVLGAGSVIAGWDQGLVGAQAGSRIQLDIPSDLAYGEAARDEIIGENEDLTFVIDVRAVIPPVDPEDEPTEMGIDPSEGVTEVTTVDLRDGEGAELEMGQTAIVRYVLFRGDNGVLLESSWQTEAPNQSTTINFVMDADSFPVLVEGMEGMKVGGRRAITFPPAYPDWGFGPDGNPTGGLPANTDAVLVVDLLGAYGDPS